MGAWRGKVKLELERAMPYTDGNTSQEVVMEGQEGQERRVIELLEEQNRQLVEANKLLKTIKYVGIWAVVALCVVIFRIS